MKKMLLGLAFLAAGGLLGAESYDRSGVYQCKCDAEPCQFGDFALTYNRDTLLLRAQGPRWALTAYVSRQENLNTGEVYLTTPENYSIGKISIAFTGEGELRSPQANFSCTFKNPVID